VCLEGLGQLTMMSGPQIALLPDGRRLHLNHGPIDLIIEAFGALSEIEAAYRQAAEAFPDVLPGLVAELDLLRRSVGTMPEGGIGRRMAAACARHRQIFVTPMAAVAGAVADHMLAALVKGRDLEKAYVNNGGDIAFHLTPGATLTAGLVADYHLPALDATCALTYQFPVRGLATSGWKGRSHSLGIADSVTVLSEHAASADVAATLIANAVDAVDPAIQRMPAREFDPDSDLGDRLVTIDVGSLADATIALALDQGRIVAETMMQAGHIRAVVLVLQKNYRNVGTLPAGLLPASAA
jgi:ApbE superfamily uncharacterized protein (UPF0280 family)